MMQGMYPKPFIGGPPLDYTDQSNRRESSGATVSTAPWMQRGPRAGINALNSAAAICRICRRYFPRQFRLLFINAACLGRGFAAGLRALNGNGR